MRIVIQRVSEARVEVEEQTIGEIGRGLLVLVGVGRDDTEDDARYLARKTAALRIFADEAGTMNRSLVDVGGDVLCVSQFTLMASTRKGCRPSWQGAAGHELAVPLYERFCALIEAETGRPAARGRFGADMQVSLTNDGPVTLVLDSKHRGA